MLFVYMRATKIWISKNAFQLFFSLFVFLSSNDLIEYENPLEDFFFLFECNLRTIVCGAESEDFVGLSSKI